MHSVLITRESLKRHWELRNKVNMNLIIWLSWKSSYKCSIMKCTEFTLFSFLPSLFFLRKIKFSIISIQGNKATTPTQELKPKCVFKIIKSYKFYSNETGSVVITNLALLALQVLKQKLKRLIAYGYLKDLICFPD